MPGGWYSSRERGSIKIIITMSLLMSLGLAAPTARGDDAYPPSQSKDDLCGSMRVGIKAFEAIDREVMPSFLELLRQGGFDLEGSMSIYRRFCIPTKDYLARRRWGLLSESDKCTAVRAWHSIMSTWFEFFSMPGWQVSRTILEDFEDAVDQSFRAMSELGCPGQ